MPNNDSQIANAFLQRLPIKKSLHSIVRYRKGNGGSWYGAYNHGLAPRAGVARFSYDEGGVLWSYESMQLARWLPDGALLVNADDGPSMMTRAQQRALREALKRHPPKRVALVPFTALRSARVEPHNVEVLAVTADREIEDEVVCRNKNCAQAGTTHTHTRRRHFLGETLFRVARREWREVDGGEHQVFVNGYDYFVSGLDRNDDPRKRNFFLAKLPDGVKPPKSVNQALGLLRPKGLPRTALRQGEWFLVPAPNKKFKPEQILKDMKQSAGRYTEDLKAGVVLVSADPKEQLERMQMGGWGMYSRRTRHRATRLVCNGAVYVSGMLRDAEHGPLKLGDGKTWFRVVRNTADGAWRAGGDVD